MQEKMQYMISLQYAAQQQAKPCPELLGAVVKDRPPLAMLPQEGRVVPGATITHAAAVDAAAAAGLPPPPQQKGRSIIHGNGPYPTYLPASSSYGREMANMEGVGQGHIYFPSDYAKPEHHPILSSEQPMPHYGAGHEIDDPDHIDSKHQHHPRSHHHHHHHSHYCGCLFRCVQYWRNAEALHRSFCYSAIDGMLTGAGILAAFVGMGVVTARSSEGMHLFVVAFSLASCSSDAICMALGHVWTTYVLANSSANERRTERLSFEQNRADAKGKLVDMLLSRGMLKIDAMSIADTLEGYPDIFVSALVGDSGYTLGDESLLSSGSSQGQFHPDDDNFGPFQGLSRAHASYGRFNEWGHDPEAASVKAALGESRTEAVIMMLSFALFSVLPSLIFLWLSSVMNVNPYHSGRTTVSSVTVSLTSFIMLLLGIWKRYGCERRSSPLGNLLVLTRVMFACLRCF